MDNADINEKKRREFLGQGQKNMHWEDKSMKVDEAYNQLNRKFEEQKTQKLARSWQLPYFAIHGFPIEGDALATIPKDRSLAARAIVFYKEGALIKIGVVDPKKSELKALLEWLKQKKFEINLYLISSAGFDFAHQQYKKILHVSRQDSHNIYLQSSGDYVGRLKEASQSKKNPIAITPSDMVSMIIGAAVEMRSSDIHLEPSQSDFKIRYRIDGVLQDVASLPKSVYGNLLSRIKLLAKLKLNITSSPQDGSFSIGGDGGNLDLRVSTLPVSGGETLVIRLLGHEGVGLEIERLGLNQTAKERLLFELKKPNGMILTTGPTGSGKTTTLYSFLSLLNNPGTKIITLEDPVEYRLEGVVQTPITGDKKIGFAGGLRSVLRQDPDVVMVGEIRDHETAETACAAALTGHMVLSTLHTNDAAGAIPRLLDMGVKPVTLAPALNALIAQRLLRRICKNCKEVYRPGNEEARRVEMILSQISKNAQIPIPKNKIFYHSRGCKECHNLSYRGRVGVFEVFVVDEQIEQLIFDQSSATQIKHAAIDQGMLTMQQDGILKALQGLTDLAEVWRVTEG